MKVLTIGTCRVYRSSFRMQGAGLEMFRFPHRIHTLRQTIQALRYMAGEPVLPDNLAHTLSRRAAVILCDAPEPFAEIAGLRDSLPPLDAYDRFIIEVSSPKEHYATPDGGAEVLINSLVAHDMTRLADTLEPLYQAGALRRLSGFRVEASAAETMASEMRTIKNRLRRPILWVPHGNVADPKPGEESLHRARAKLARTVETGARRMADDFLDPATLGMARAVLFEAGGRDLNHYTRKGQIALAEAMLHRIAPDLILDRHHVDMPDDQED